MRKFWLLRKPRKKEIKNLLKQSIPFIGQRLRVLLILKQNEKVEISRRDVAKLAGVDPKNLSSIINNLIVNKLALFG